MSNLAQIGGHSKDGKGARNIGLITNSGLNSGQQSTKAANQGKMVSSKEKKFGSHPKGSVTPASAAHDIDFGTSTNPLGATNSGQRPSSRH
mmetsp:Transcript_28063/g.42430  ORF Transcript_28063/g.42430 Transcript_28063/m.42430 type:complete len:91 (+) Transcript_28063:2767-3039(+)